MPKEVGAAPFPSPDTMCLFYKHIDGQNRWLNIKNVHFCSTLFKSNIFRMSTFLNQYLMVKVTELQEFCEVFTWKTHIAIALSTVDGRPSLVPLCLISRT